MSHKEPDSRISVKVEFGEKEGQISLAETQKQVEDIKPKAKTTYKQIQKYVEENYGFKVHTAYIAEVKRNLGLSMYDAPNAVEELKRPRSHPTEKMVLAIKETYAFRYNILGYRKGENGEPEIVPEEADIVKEIFQKYLAGDTTDQIKAYLEGNGYLTKKGKSVWSKGNIYSILTNERYCGDVIYQKTYVENCITKKVKRNRGELTKYLVTNNHPAIIDRETFKMAQTEIARRGSMRKVSDKTITEQGKYSGKFALTNLLICGECGSPYRRRTWVRNGVSRKVWRCVSRVDHGTEFCKNSVTLDEEKLKKAICRALTVAVRDRKEVMDLIVSNLSYAFTGENDVLDTYAIEKQMETIRGEIDGNIELLERTEGDKGRIEKIIERQTNELAVLREQLKLVQAKIESNQSVNTELERIKKLLTDDSLNFDVYDDRSVRLLIEYIRVMEDGKIVIMLKGGITIEERVE